jgi:pyruvate-formate lyase-activating enzyme
MQNVKNRLESSKVCLVYGEAVVDISAVRRWGRQMKEAETGVSVLQDASGVITLVLKPHSILLVDELIARRPLHNKR